MRDGATGTKIRKIADTSWPYWSSGLLVGLGVLLNACGPASHHLEEVGTDVSFTVAVGDSILFAGVELIVPELGEGVSFAAHGENEWTSLELQHALDGTAVARAETSESWASLQAVTHEERTFGVSRQAATAPCSDRAYSKHRRWRSTYNWYFNPSGASSASAAEATLKAAASNITSARNDCGRADNVSATHAYKGRTSTSVGVSSSGNISCAGRNNRSVVQFGSLSGYLGATCWYWDGSGYLVEADIRFRNNVSWIYGSGVPSGCSNRPHLESLATHEFGHAFGLNHPGGSNHDNLTMHPGLPSCSNSKRTLGMGDLLGLESHY